VASTVRQRLVYDLDVRGSGSRHVVAKERDECGMRLDRDHSIRMNRRAKREEPGVSTRVDHEPDAPVPFDPGVLVGAEQRDEQHTRPEGIVRDVESQLAAVLAEDDRARPTPAAEERPKPALAAASQPAARA